MLWFWVADQGKLCGYCSNPALFLCITAFGNMAGGAEGGSSSNVSCSIPFLFPLFLFSLKQDKKDLYEPVCSIPIITSPKEEERLIESSMKVTALFNCGFVLSVLKHRTHLFFFSLAPNSLLLNCCIIEATINTPTPGMSLLFSPHFSGKVAFWLWEWKIMMNDLTSLLLVCFGF